MSSRGQGAIGVAAVVVVAAMITSGCTEPNPRYCTDTCRTEAYPVCDVDGSLAGTPNTCIAVTCTPGEFIACRGDEAITCSAGGEDYDITACDLGCNPAGRCNECVPGTLACAGGALERCGTDGVVAATEACAAGCVDGPDAHCAYLEPKYLPDICDALAVDDSFVVSSPGTLDTSLNTTCNGGIIAQSGGPEICVLRYGRIAVLETIELKVTGARALALVADRELTITGTLDVSATNFVNGPGGGTLLSGALAGGAGGTGGGGAGFVTAGGAGGTADVDGGAANGRPPVYPETLPVLVGGAATGAQSDPREEPFITGPGGGAAVAIACRGPVDISGTIDAGGGGGAGGFNFFGYLGGSGGGAGGHVVLQGLSVSVTGSFFANGGGGGAGWRSDGTPGMTGVDGDRFLFAASGGTSASGNGGGGTGGVQGGIPGFGLRRTISPATAGGGGGSVGLMQTFIPAGGTATLTPAMASPTPRAAATIGTR